MFYPKDRVIYNGNMGIITKIRYNTSGDQVCTVSFDDKKTYPKDIEIVGYKLNLEFDMDFDLLDLTLDINKSCPKCGTKWTETTFGNNKWYDCKKCNKKKEDIV